MLTVRIQEKNYSESIMVLKLKDGAHRPAPQGTGKDAGAAHGSPPLRPRTASLHNRRIRI